MYIKKWLLLVAMIKESNVIFAYQLDNSPNENFTNLVKPIPYGKPTFCSWLPACICRDESDYTNGTYKLMVNCTKSGLRDIPENIPNVTTVLTLNGNYIQNITSGAFSHLINLKYLDLSNNYIEGLNENAFEGLETLRTLELGQNQIRYRKASLPYLVFKPLKNLVRLNLHQRIDDIDESESYPTQALSQLKTLKQLLIDGIEPKNLSHWFSDMSHLTTLDLSSEYGRCNLSKIVVDMFNNLNSVYDLKVSNCSIDFVERGSFAELTNLTNLDLSYNENLQFKNLANVTFGLQGKHMREIKLIKIHETFGDCTRIEKDHLVYFQKVQVDNLYVDFNRLAYVSEDAVEFIPRSLLKLSLSNNILLPGEYIHKLFEKSVFSNLRVLTMAEQNMNYDALKFFNNKTRHMFKHTNFTKDFIKIRSGEVSPNETSDLTISSFCSNCRFGNVSYETVLSVPQNLKEFDVRGLQIRNELKNICICEPNSLIRVNLDRNVFWSWRGPITGFSKANYLNLAWNSCDNLSDDVFDQFPSLQYLILTRNFLNDPISKDTDGRIFRNLKRLFYLDLVDNKIRHIPPNLFQGLESLAILDLSFNFLTQIDLDLAKHPLQLLDLHDNLLNKIGSGIINKFKSDRKKDVPYRYIDLSNNRLSCACQDLYFIAWVARTNVNFRGLSEYTCTYKNGSIMKLSSAEGIYMTLSKDCADYEPVIIVTSFCIVLFFTVIVGGLIHQYRWDLRYLYYTMKLKMKDSKQFTTMNNENDFEFDAFISYASENSSFVISSLIPKLENTCRLKLLVHGRDFMVGEYVYDNIMQAIKTSRKTLILMSRDFLKSEWCIFEMNMARLEGMKTGRNVVCLLMLEQVSVSGLPLEIIDIIRQQTYLELPEDSQDINTFWGRVHSALVD